MFIRAMTGQLMNWTVVPSSQPGRQLSSLLDATAAEAAGETCIHLDCSSHGSGR